MLLFQRESNLKLQLNSPFRRFRFLWVYRKTKRDWKKDTIHYVSYVHSTKYEPRETHTISKFGLLLYKCQKSLHSTKIAYLTAKFWWLPCHVFFRVLGSHPIFASNKRSFFWIFKRCISKFRVQIYMTETLIPFAIPW